MSLLIAIALSSAPALAPDARCENAKILRTDDTRTAPGIRPLGEEPPARHLLAVVRSIDGCNMPVSAKAPVSRPVR